jgi:hypothetical protein
MTEAVALGTLIYAAALLGCWMAAGRPDGAERDMLTLLRSLA